MACTDVIEPLLVEVMRSCNSPISVARLGWYPTALGGRPSSAETSEPAWVKRKMLSMNSSTARPWSRKCSAERHGGQPHALASAGRLIHLAEHERDLVEHAALLQIVVEVVALARAL